MTGFTHHERAITSLRGTARGQVTTSDLAQGIIDAANEGVRCEKLLAERALTYVRALTLTAAVSENAKA